MLNSDSYCSDPGCDVHANLDAFSFVSAGAAGSAASTLACSVTSAHAQMATHIHEYRQTLRAVALRLVGDEADADDLVQDTLERGLRRVSELPPQANVRGWLITILRNLFVDRTRCRRRWPAPRPITPADDVPALATAPRPAWTEITQHQLEEAVACLDPEFRRVYELHAFERRSYHEIAAMLGLPLSTVGTRLYRARRKLKQLLLQ